MPRNVRNFWIELDVDGRKKKVCTGPRTANGEFEITIRVRDHGDISPEELKIWGRIDSDGTLSVDAKTSRGVAWMTLLEGRR